MKLDFIQAKGSKSSETPQQLKEIENIETFASGRRNEVGYKRGDESFEFEKI